MALLPPGMGAGAWYGSPLRGSLFYPDEEELSSPEGLEVQFFSPAEEFIGLLGTTYGNAPNLEIEILDDKIGGLISFTIKTSRNIQIPFFNQMITKLYVDGVHWYTGELTYIPDQDRRDVQWMIEGRGYIHYLETVIINKIYNSAGNLAYIVRDIIQNEVATETPVIYNPALIDLPNYTPTTLEFNKKSSLKAMDKILELANTNFTQTEYIYGVNKDRHFYFLPMDSELLGGFFEGYQFQEPDIETSDDKLVNKIDVFRAQEDSQQVEPVATVEDTESQGKYGIRYKKITIPDFFDTTTAQRVATSLLEEFKEPKVSISLDNQKTLTDPYTFGLYSINSKPDEYSLLVTEADDLSDWTQNVSNTTVSEESTIVFSGKKSIKCVTASGSQGEYIEYELDEPVYFPTILRFYVRQETAGEAFTIIAYDEDGNTLDLETAFLITEAGDFIVTEAGDFIVTEDGTIGYNIDLIGDFIKVEFDISELDNLDKVRILFTTDSTFTMYFDRFDVFVDTWRQRQLRLQKIKYKLSRTSFLASPTFGEKFPSLIDDLKEISKKQAGLYGIFEKETP